MVVGQCKGGEPMTTAEYRASNLTGVASFHVTIRYGTPYRGKLVGSTRVPSIQPDLNCLLHH